LPTGSSAASAGCEARSAEHPADGNTRRLLPGAERPATTSNSMILDNSQLEKIFIPVNGGGLSNFRTDCWIQISQPTLFTIYIRGGNLTNHFWYLGLILWI